MQSKLALAVPVPRQGPELCTACPRTVLVLFFSKRWGQDSTDDWFITAGYIYEGWEDVRARSETSVDMAVAAANYGLDVAATAGQRSTRPNV